MMEMIVFAAFVEFHTIDGRKASLNTEQITSIVRGKDGEGNKLFIDGVHCVIGFTNGKFISVSESCDEVLRKIGDPR